LTDFGAARELEEEEQFLSLCGTEEYLVTKIEFSHAGISFPSSDEIQF